MENTNNKLIAKKSLGQNFIHSQKAINTMIENANIAPSDIILEIGPGNGALTERLLQTGARVIAIEKDNRAVPLLSDRFSKEISEKRLVLIHEDILSINIASLGLENHKYKIVANIPYYISGEFLRKFLESDIQPTDIIIMLQKELAKRIVDEKESILSISVKSYGNPKYIMTVPRKFFRPIPNVDSAIISIREISKEFFSNQKDLEKRYFEIVRSGFAHKRKILIRNLENVIEKGILEELWLRENWSKTLRAEELHIKDWKKILFSTENQ